MVAGYGPKQIGLALIGVTQEAAIHVKFRMKGLFVKNEMRQDVDNFETESERNLAKFLAPCQLPTLSDAIWKLARNGGYNKAEALHFIDEAGLNNLDIAEKDRGRILLAVWLHTLHLHEYGPGLVRSNIVSLPLLAAVSDEKLQRAGVLLMGHRRILLRHIREDLAMRPDLVAPHERKYLAAVERAAAAVAEDAAAAAETEAKKSGLSADVLGSGGGLSLNQLPGQGKPVIDLETKLANREAWHEPWKATSNAALTCDGGGATGYFAARTPREISLKCADGSRLTLY